MDTICSLFKCGSNNSDNGKLHFVMCQEAKCHIVDSNRMVCQLYHSYDPDYVKAFGQCKNNKCDLKCGMPHFLPCTYDNLLLVECCKSDCSIVESDRTICQLYHPYNQGYINLYGRCELVNCDRKCGLPHFFTYPCRYGDKCRNNTCRYGHPQKFAIGKTNICDVPNCNKKCKRLHIIP